MCVCMYVVYVCVVVILPGVQPLPCSLHKPKLVLRTSKIIAFDNPKQHGEQNWWVPGGQWATVVTHRGSNGGFFVTLYFHIGFTFRQTNIRTPYRGTTNVFSSMCLCPLVTIVAPFYVPFFRFYFCFGLVTFSSLAIMRVWWYRCHK